MKQQKPAAFKNTQKTDLEKKSGWGKYAAIALPLVLAAIPFAFGRYFEFHYPDPFDSAAYVYSAEHILTGAKLGVEEIPTAQPGTLLVNMLGVKLFGFSEFGPKLIQTVLQAVALVLMFYTMRKLYGTLAAAIGVVVASVYLSAPLIAKFGNVKEQHMIAFMVIGVCCYVLRQLGGKWWLAVLAGAALGWGPMFKQTGVSAIGAVGLFVIIQPIFRWRSLKQTIADIGLLAGGFVLGVAPVCLWIIANDAAFYLPYRWLLGIFLSSSSEGKFGTYVAAAREVVSFKEQFPQVMRYYGCLILPMAMALGALFIWACRQLLNLKSKISNPKFQISNPPYERFVILFSVWWILDAAFVWISPRGYEQYYLPLCASAPMTGGYLVAMYRDRVIRSNYYPGWILAGVAGLIVMIAMVWNIIFGIMVSPFSGQPYGERSRGYVQRWEEIRQFRLGYRMDWQEAGDYIREHSKPADKIYVWGWFPGIYIRAERISSSPQAFDSDMYKSPAAMEATVKSLLEAFAKQPPKFLVDSRKYEFPYDRPPLPLWPTMTKSRAEFQLVEGTDAQIDAFDARYAKDLAEQFKDGEAERYIAMKPLRDYIRHNYKIVGVFGRQHILFELKNATP